MKRLFGTYLFAASAMLSLLTQCSADVDQPLPGQVDVNWKFEGYLGAYVDKISEQRILNQEQWDLIYPETELAFSLKEDDKAYPRFGAWRYEFWGKYMLSVIAAAKYYQSQELKERIRVANHGLLQYMEDNGYLGTYNRSDFVVGNNWNVWGRKYTLWGLVESYQLLGDPEILQGAIRFVDHLMTEVGPGAQDIVKTGRFYGMPSTSILQPMVKLYSATNDPKYLEYAEYIVSQWSKHPEGLPDLVNRGLEGKPVHVWFADHDPMDWAKGYEFTSCVEGLVELYGVTGKPEYLTAALNIHDVMIEFERTPIGSVSFNDKYVGSAGLINTVAEVCDAVYWNRLSFKLFEISDQVKYVDEMERTLYNSLLCAFNPEGTWGLRRIRTSHIHIPAQNHFLHYHQCCTDNLPRGLFQAAEFALVAKENEIRLNMFSPGKGTINFGHQEVGLQIEGDFMDHQQIRGIFSLEEAMDFTLRIRNPYWSKRISVTVQDEEQSWSSSADDVTISRSWQPGDKFTVDFELELRWEYFEPEKFDSTFHDIGYYDQFWAGMKFMGSTWEVNKQQYQHVDTLDVAQALPKEPAVMFFYGPVALSRDIRVSQADIFSRIPDPGINRVSLTPMPADDRFWKLYQIDFGNGTKEVFCDFSSAGNTWDFDSKFNTWCLLLE